MNRVDVEFDGELLGPLRDIYTDVVAPNLGRAAMAGGGLRFGAVRFGDLVWVSADDGVTYHQFEVVFDALKLADVVAPLIDYDHRVVLYQGFFIVSHGVREAQWHIDYTAGSNAYSLLTPLDELDADHGHLLYGDGQRYEYRRGHGILVGEELPHCPEPHPPGQQPRVLVSMTFGSDRMACWPLLADTVGRQSRFVMQPCGHPRGTCVCAYDFGLTRV